MIVKITKKDAKFGITSEEFDFDEALGLDKSWYIIFCSWFEGKNLYTIIIKYRNLKNKDSYVEEMAYFKYVKMAKKPKVISKISTIYNPTGFAEQPKSKKVDKRRKSIYKRKGEFK